MCGLIIHSYAAAITGGESIVKALQECAAFVVIMTPQARESRWVQREVTLADSWKKPLFPLLLDGENWEIFVLTQFSNVTNRRMPPATFYDKLAKYASRNTQEGEDVTQRATYHEPVDETLQAEIDNPPEPDERSNAPQRDLRSWFGGHVRVIIIMILSAGVLVTLFASSLGRPDPALQDLTQTAAEFAMQTEFAATEFAMATSTPSPAPPSPTNSPLPPGTATQVDPHDLTATQLVQPGTATAVIQFGSTATEAMLQRTVDAQAATNAALLAENTQIAVTATAQATGDNATVTLTIYRDEDSFTLYLPQMDQPLSMVGLEFHVTTSTGEAIVWHLDKDFAAFLGLPFENVSSLGAACFRLVRANANRPVPQVCQGRTLLVPQQLASADIFWRDTSAGLDRTVLVYQNGQLRAACGAEAYCELRLLIEPE